jgi:hypothetical protein
MSGPMAPSATQAGSLRTIPVIVAASGPSAPKISGLLPTKQ